MVVLTFRIGTNLFNISVNGKKILVSGGLLVGIGKYVTMDVVILTSTKKDLLKEFPDLRGKSISKMRKIAKERWKEKINNLTSEKEVVEYVIQEFESKGGVLVKRENV